MGGFAQVRQFRLKGNEVSLYESDISDDVEGSFSGALATIVVPLGVTLAGSYYITKWAYPRDFTFFKWIGVPVSIGILGLLTTIAMGVIVSELE